MITKSLSCLCPWTWTTRMGVLPLAFLTAWSIQVEAMQVLRDLTSHEKGPSKWMSSPDIVPTRLPPRVFAVTRSALLPRSRLVIVHLNPFPRIDVSWLYSPPFFHGIEICQTTLDVINVPVDLVGKEFGKRMYLILGHVRDLNRHSKYPLERTRMPQDQSFVPLYIPPHAAPNIAAS